MKTKAQNQEYRKTNWNADVLRDDAARNSLSQSILKLSEDWKAGVQAKLKQQEEDKAAGVMPDPESDDDIDIVEDVRAPAPSPVKRVRG